VHYCERAAKSDDLLSGSPRRSFRRIQIIITSVVIPLTYRANSIIRLFCIIDDRGGVGRGLRESAVERGMLAYIPRPLSKNTPQHYSEARPRYVGWLTKLKR
jgi:hypothetical protein